MCVPVPVLQPLLLRLSGGFGFHLAQGADQAAVVGAVAHGQADVAAAVEGLLAAAVFYQDVLLVEQAHGQLVRMEGRENFTQEVVGLRGDDAQEGDAFQFAAEGAALLLKLFAAAAIVGFVF